MNVYCLISILWAYYLCSIAKGSKVQVYRNRDVLNITLIQHRIDYSFMTIKYVNKNEQYNISRLYSISDVEKVESRHKYF